MIMAENTLLVLLLILGIGLVIPEFFRKKVPLVAMIIILGAVLGPHGLDVIVTNPTLEFFGFLGMTFLMLMAGLDTDASKLKDSKKAIFIMALLNGGIPFLVGFLGTLYFGYPLTTALLVGVVFISSSVAIIIPSLRRTHLFQERFGQIVLAAVLIADIVSLIALSFVLQTTEQIANLPLPFYYLLLFFSIFILFKILPKISTLALKGRFSKDVGEERRIRFILLIIISIVAYFALLGVHPILAAFLVGLALSGVIKHDKSLQVYSKIHTLGYGLFIPVFFFIVGMDLDLSLFRQFDVSNIIMISLLSGLIISKIISGYIAGRLVNFNKQQSWTYGLISIPQLTTTLAVTYTAQSLGILDSILTTTIILIAIITTLFGPIAVELVNNRGKKK